MEAAGELVDNLFLIAPGSPTLSRQRPLNCALEATFDNPDYVSVLISVFTRRLGGPELIDCLETVRDRNAFKIFAKKLAGDVPSVVVDRITEVAMTCLDTTCNSASMLAPGIRAPILVLKAAGDSPSFIEDLPVTVDCAPNVLELPCDHYRLLMPEGVDMLSRHIISQLEFTSHFGRAA